MNYTLFNQLSSQFVTRYHSGPPESVPLKEGEVLLHSADTFLDTLSPDQLRQAAAHHALQLPLDASPATIALALYSQAQAVQATTHDTPNPSEDTTQPPVAPVDASGPAPAPHLEVAPTSPPSTDTSATHQKEAGPLPASLPQARLTKKPFRARQNDHSALPVNWWEIPTDRITLRLTRRAARFLRDHGESKLIEQLSRGQAVVQYSVPETN